jgi:AcrR family transcriptional regulator
MRKKEANIREKIIRNGLKIFARKGFFRTTVDDIARATGVAKGTVYLYFRDKQDLYIATIEEHFSRALDTLYATDTKPISPSKKMEEIAVNYIDYITKLRTSYTMFTFENINQTGKSLEKLHLVIQPKIQKMIEIISNIIKNGIKNNEFRDVEPEIAAFYFISAIRAIFLSHFYMSDMTFKTDTVLKLFFEGLKKRR